MIITCGKYNLHIKYSLLIWLNLIISSLGALVIEAYQMSNLLYYFADGINIVLLCLIIIKSPRLKKIKHLGIFKIILAAYAFITVIGIVGNDVSMLLAVWGMRNIWRFIVYFIACILLLDKEDIDSFFEFLPKVFWINFIVALYQYFVLGYKNDFLGGIFGIEQGCNAGLMIFLNLVIAYLFSQYLCGKRKIITTVPYILIYFVLTVMSETKGNYVFFIIIFITCLISARKKPQVIILVIVGVASLYIGLNILANVLPDSVTYILNYDSAVEYLNSDYYGFTTFTRNTQLEVTNTYFFRNNVWLYLFGYGTGACDMCSFFASAFYVKYGYMNYRFLGVAMTTLQNGYLGLAVLFLFLAALIWTSVKIKTKTGDDYSVYKITTISYICFIIIYIFYASPYVDMGYWLWFICSIPIVVLKSKDAENDVSKSSTDIMESKQKTLTQDQL